LKRDYREAILDIPDGLPALPFDGRDKRASEQYRILRTNVLQHPARPKVVAVSSAASRDGKTITSINLAGILSMKSDVRVAIMDADLRRGSVAPAMGIPPEPGLTDVLTGRCTLDEAIVRIDRIPNLHVLPAGAESATPAELLDSGLFRSTVASLRDHFSFI